jgi:hypothetical protein
MGHSLLWDILHLEPSFQLDGCSDPMVWGLKTPNPKSGATAKQIETAT